MKCISRCQLLHPSLTCVGDTRLEVQRGHVRDGKGREIEAVGTGRGLWSASMSRSEVDTGRVRCPGREGEGEGSTS